MKNTIKPLLVQLLGLLLSLAVPWSLGCSGSGSSSTPAPSGGVEKTSSVQGTVDNRTGTLTGSTKLQKAALSQALAINGCESVSYTVKLIGGGGAVAYSGSTDASGVFTSQWTETVESASAEPSEIVIDFSCNTGAGLAVRCFGKPGDTAMVCDPVSTSLVYALEQSLGTDIAADDLFAGLQVATMAKGMAEMCTLLGRLDPNNDCATQLAEATTPEEVLQTIRSLPIGSLFASLEAISKEIKALNELEQAGGGSTVDEELLRASLSDVWTMDKLVSLLVGLGIQITVDVDEGGDGGPGLYSTLMSLLGDISGLDFIPKFRQYLSDRFDAMVAGTASADNSAMVCMAHNEQNWQNKAITYPPEQNGTMSGLTEGSTLKKLTCLGQKAVDLNIATLSGGVVTPNSGMRVMLMLMPRLVELNRNDVDGTRGADNDDPWATYLSVIDVFPEFEELAMSPQGCGQHLVILPGDGEIDWAASDINSFAACIALLTLPSGKPVDTLFAGLLGVYRSLVDPALRDIRISLTDVYEALVSGMTIRLSGSTNSMGGGIGVNVTDCDPNSTGGNCTNWVPFMLRDSNLRDSNNHRILYFECPAQLCPSGLPPWYFGSGDQYVDMTTAQMEQMAETYKPSYDLLFESIATIPDFATLRSRIFGAAHHEPWNIAGSAFYQVVGKDTDGNGSADKPILCAVLNGSTVVREFTEGTSHVSCEIAAGTWDAETGWVETADVNNSVKYARYFGLQERSNGDDADRHYALINLSTGMELMVGGRQFRIHDTSAVGGGGDGQTVESYIKENCWVAEGASGDRMRKCWTEDFLRVSMPFPNQNVGAQGTTAEASFYPMAQFWPYSTSIKMQNCNTGDPNGQCFEFQRGIVATDNGTPNDQSDDFPVCLKASAVTTSASDPYSATAINITADKLFDCFNNPDAGSAFYYFDPYGYWMGDGSQSSRATYKLVLLHKDGFTMQDGDGDQIWDPAAVTLESVEAVMSGKKLGPVVAVSWPPSFQVRNSRHDRRFDPFCLDQDSDGVCDCYRDVNNDGSYSLHLNATSTPTAADCTLADAVGDEPTMSEAPIWSGAPEEPKFWKLVELCGGQCGAALRTCLTGAANAGGPAQNIVLNQMGGVNWNRVFACSVSTRRLMWVDVYGLTDAGRSDQNFGGGCGSPDGFGNPTAGEVCLMRPVRRNNAYDIARPATLLSLISTATQATGTNITLPSDAAVFGFSEAVAMAMVRLSLPLSDVTVKSPDFANAWGTQSVSTDPSSYVEQKGFTSRFQRLYLPNAKSQDVVSAVLRRFLIAGGYLSAAE